jgi:hypothetical protein
MKIIKALSFCFILILIGCDSEPTYEENENNMKQDEENVGPAGAPDIEAEDMEMYCCTNHDPAHCGNSDELESLSENKGCEGFD